MGQGGVDLFGKAAPAGLQEDVSQGQAGDRHQAGQGFYGARLVRDYGLGPIHARARATRGSLLSGSVTALPEVKTRRSSSVAGTERRRGGSRSGGRGLANVSQGI